MTRRWPNINNDAQSKTSRQCRRALTLFVLVVSFFAHLESVILTSSLVISKPDVSKPEFPSNWRKAIILTTGFQLQICPFESTSSLLNHTNLTCHNIQTTNDELVNSSSLISQGTISSGSILPANKRNSYFEKSLNGQLEPDRQWIVDLDYYNSKSFDHNGTECKQQLNQTAYSCEHGLLLVWIDKNNKTLNGGFLNQDETHFWLRQISPPISLIERVAKLTNQTQTQTRVQPLGIAIDSQRSAIHVIVSQGNQSEANLIISGKIRRNSGNLDLDQISEFNGCSADRKQPENFGFDEASNLLFYTDKQTARIFALNLTSRNPPLDGMKPTLSEAIAVDLERKETPLIGATLDQKNRKLIWIESNNALMRSSLSGREVAEIETLSAKPQIRSSHSMRISDDIILISDQFKKSLIALQPNEKRKRGQPTHNVLLVGSPSVFGFRLINRESSPPKNVEKVLPNSTSDHRKPTRDVFEDMTQEIIDGLRHLLSNPKMDDLETLSQRMSKQLFSCSSTRLPMQTKQTGVIDTTTKELGEDQLSDDPRRVRSPYMFIAAVTLLQAFIFLSLICRYLKKRKLAQEQQQELLFEDTKDDWSKVCPV